MASKVLFSPVRGVVVRDGVPVGGATVERTYRWVLKDVRGRDTVVTDPDGTFRFDAATGSGLLSSIMPHEPIIEQKIVITHDGQAFEAWVYSKRDYVENGEAKRPLVMRCDLQTPPRAVAIDDFRRYFGLCDLE